MEMNHTNEQVKELASLDLPPPSIIQNEEKAELRSAELQRVNSDIAKMDLEKPSRLDEAERFRMGDKTSKQLTELISTLELPDPEAIGEAARRADGRTASEPTSVGSSLTLVRLLKLILLVRFPYRIAIACTIRLLSQFRNWPFQIQTHLTLQVFQLRILRHFHFQTFNPACPL